VIAAAAKSARQCDRQLNFKWGELNRCKRPLGVVLITGVSEALELSSVDVDLDNLLITVHGKGRKDPC
jgi:hypothetical protein